MASALLCLSASPQTDECTSSHRAPAQSNATHCLGTASVTPVGPQSIAPDPTAAASLLPPSAGTCEHVQATTPIFASPPNRYGHFASLPFRSGFAYVTTTFLRCALQYECSLQTACERCAGGPRALALRNHSPALHHPNFHRKAAAVRWCRGAPQSAAATTHHQCHFERCGRGSPAAPGSAARINIRTALGRSVSVAHEGTLSALHLRID